ncbi:MAG: carbohydrate binding family 9 domain-containing protein [Bryobacterales bacterium]|nr:carbohydrate binding family 9 domain-containing protein [Bryobacterales bacterium]
MRRAALALLTISSVAAAWAQVSAQKPPTIVIKELAIPKIASPPRLEEFLDGQGRGDMKRVDDFRQRQPGDGVPVSRPTSAWIGYDEKNFYTVFVCKSPPEQTRARMSKREDIMSDDIVGLFLDTYFDHQRSYEFFVNAYGIQADAIESEGQNDDFSFDTLWYSEGRLTPDGFIAILAIPFKSLRFSPKEMQEWGLGLGRFIPTNNENSFWPYITQRVSGFSPQLGDLTGLNSISPGRNLQIIPYGAFGHTHYLDNPTDGTPSFRVSNDPHAGLDAKAVLHDTLTLDITLNPDFSQVESDDPQVTVNQRYEVIFPEKRPFFIENNTYFITPENLFFSRRIVDPEFGARLTGKAGRWSMGLLTIDDRAPGSDAAPADPGYGERALIGVARVQREIGQASSIGMLFTDREFGVGYNRVGALDARLKLNSNWTFTPQVIASQTRDYVTGALSGGDAYNIGINYNSRATYWNLNYIDRAEGFRADLGYVPRVNIRQANQFWNRHFHPDSKELLSFGPQLYAMLDFDHRNVQQDWVVQPGFNFEFSHSTYIGVNRGEIFERFNNLNFRRHNAYLGLHSEYFKRATIDINYNQGSRINYDVPSSIPAFLGNGQDFQATLTFRPTNRIKIDEIYFYTHLKTRPDSFAGAAPDLSTVFVNHLIRSRLNYQFTRELSLRVILDYNAVLQNPALISLDRQKQITGDILLTYLLHPGTAFYIGYTDTLENLALIPGDPATTVRTGFPSVTTSRQFFAKISYLFRF